MLPNNYAFSLLVLHIPLCLSRPLRSSPQAATPLLTFGFCVHTYPLHPYYTIHKFSLQLSWCMVNIWLNTHMYLMKKPPYHKHWLIFFNCSNANTHTHLFSVSFYLCLFSLHTYTNAPVDALPPSWCDCIEETPRLSLWQLVFHSDPRTVVLAMQRKARQNEVERGKERGVTCKANISKTMKIKCYERWTVLLFFTTLVSVDKGQLLFLQLCRFFEGRTVLH